MKFKTPITDKLVRILKSNSNKKFQELKSIIEELRIVEYTLEIAIGEIANLRKRLHYDKIKRKVKKHE